VTGDDDERFAAAREPVSLKKPATDRAAAIAVACLLIAVVVVGFVLMAIDA
jgi:hypothetical protein